MALVREELAELVHKQWVGWMAYLFGKCETDHDGALTIPSWAVRRWKRQMGTPYFDLSEEEKESDRKEADKILELFKKSQ